MRVLEGRIKKRITPVRDGNWYKPWSCNPPINYVIKKRITPVRDGNHQRLFVFQYLLYIKKRITPVRDGNLKQISPSSKYTL